MKRLILASLFIFYSTIAAAESAQDLQDVSVTIKSGNGQGSGVLFTRDDATFVWTAGHVIEGLRHTRTLVDGATGTTRTAIEFKDADIVQEFTEGGRRIGEMKFDAKVIKYSDATNGEDLALLEIRKKNFTKSSVKFYLDDKIPEIGTDLLHVGSLLGQVGANSLTTGIVSQLGRVIDLGNNGVVFDQTTVTAFPGSSGGGVFLKSDHRYIGMLVRGSGEQFNLIVPARRIKAWATKTKTLWAIDPKTPFPSFEERSKILVEDSGIKFEIPKELEKHDD
jgi:S1-C subfamily serine protease